MLMGVWQSKIRCYLKAIPARIEGTAREGQDVPSISGVRHAVWAAVFFMLGIVVAWVGAERTNYLMILMGWAASVHGGRKLQLNIGHACAHGTVTGNERHDHVIGQIIHFLVVATEFNSYKLIHTQTHHNWRVLATCDDPTFLSLAQAGLRPGIAKTELYHRLKRACYSPRFHAVVLWDRIASHLRRTGIYRVTFITFWLAVGAGLTLSRSWLEFAVAFVVPLVWGYQTAQLLRFCVEHRLPTSPIQPRPTAEMRELTDAIILRPTHPLDLAIRVLVLTCDSVAHDFHHYNPKSLEWSNYVSIRARERQTAVETGRSDQYHELVGFRNALDKCFDALSKSVPVEPVLNKGNRTPLDDYASRTQPASNRA